MISKLSVLMTIYWLPSLHAFTTPNTFSDETSLHLRYSAVASRSYALFSVAYKSQFSQDQDDAEDDIEDSYLVDNANSTPTFLRGLWELIARGNNMVRGVSSDRDIRLFSLGEQHTWYPTSCASFSFSSSSNSSFRNRKQFCSLAWHLNSLHGI